MDPQFKEDLAKARDKKKSDLVDKREKARYIFYVVVILRDKTI